MVAEAAKRSTKRVAQPVEGQTNNDQKQPQPVGTRPPIGSACPSHGEQAEHSEMVRVDPRRRMRGQPDQGTLFQVGQETLLDAFGFAKACKLRRLSCGLNGVHLISPPNDCYDATMQAGAINRQCTPAIPRWRSCTGCPSAKSRSIAASSPI